MPIYEHKCNTCSIEWLEEYDLKTFDWLKENKVTLQCPECDSEDTFRCINHVPVHFKGGGVGWADNGYYAYGSYDQHVAEGKDVQIYDRKEDLERIMKGERKEAAIKRLKYENELAKKCFGPDAALTDEKAQRRIQKEVDRVSVDTPKPKVLPNKSVDRKKARALGGGRDR